MFKRAFLRGLLAVAPIAITIGIIVWLYNMIEDFIGGLYIRFIGEGYYFPGLGLLIALIIIFVIGILINNWLIRKVYDGFEKLLDKLPFVKTLYRSIGDLMSFFKGNSKMEGGRVVMVSFQGMKMMGLVSRDSFQDLPKGIGEEGDIAVYIPLSYQIGGMTVVLPKSMVQPVEMGIEEGLRFAATAGMPGQASDEIESTDEVKIDESKK